MSVRRVLALAVCLGLAACGGATPSASPTPQAAMAMPSPDRTLTPTPMTTPVSVTPKPKPSPKLTWSKTERSILKGVRSDIAVGCAPRRDDLPPRTIAAVECRPNKRPASRVGFYLFASAHDAYEVYIERILDAGLDLFWSDPTGWEHPIRGELHGGCATEDEDTCQEREATYRNDEGYANYRAVIGRLYVGVLGTRGDSEELVNWTRDDGHGVDTTPDFQTLWCFGERPDAQLPLCVPET
jgi:hypothetical protein